MKIHILNFRRLSFLGRDSGFLTTSWQFHNLGRVGHVLRTKWSPFNTSSKLNILGVRNLKLLRDCVELLGDIPPTPVSEPLVENKIVGTEDSIRQRVSYCLYTR